MSLAEQEEHLGHSPEPVAPTHREVLARSRRLSDAAAAALNDEALRVERDRMARATVHSHRTGDGHDGEYAEASAYAETRLLSVVAQLAHTRTNGFTRRIDS